MTKNQRDRLERDEEQARVLQEAGNVVWKPTLRLTRFHWHLVEDISDRVRQTGARYRPGPSAIVAGILDGVLPALVVTDMNGFAVDTDLDQEQARDFVRAWVADWLRGRLARGE